VGEGLRHARVLDRHYIPTRYPNVHPEGAAFEYYDEETAREALRCAKELFRIVEDEAKNWLK